MTVATNDKQIIQRVKRFWLVDYPDLVYQCGKSRGSIGNPSLSDMPGGTSYGNWIEEQYVELADMMRAYYATRDAYQHMDEPGKKIIKLNYLNGIADDKIYPRLHISRRWYYQRIKPDTLLEFAKKFDYWAQIYQSDWRLMDNDK